MSTEEESRREYPSITQEHSQDASKRIDIPVNRLEQIPLKPSDSYAMQIEYSIKGSAKRTAEDDDLYSDIACSMAFARLE